MDEFANLPECDEIDNPDISVKQNEMVRRKDLHIKKVFCLDDFGKQPK